MTAWVYAVKLQKLTKNPCKEVMTGNAKSRKLVLMVRVEVLL